jgi:hypothetical protein
MNDRPAQEARLVAALGDSPRLMTVLRTVRAAGLAQWRLTAGAIYGTLWNALTGRPPDHGIKDYDVAYWDADTGWDAEDAAIRKVAALAPAPLKPLIEVRNQARVPLWFEAKFGAPYPPLAHVDEAVERYLFVSDCLGVRLEADDRIDVLAPFGLDDVFAMRLRPNPARGETPNRAAKAAAMRARWPELTLEF